MHVILENQNKFKKIDFNKTRFDLLKQSIFDESSEYSDMTERVELQKRNSIK